MSEKKRTTVTFNEIALPTTIPMHGQPDLTIGTDIFGNVQFKSEGVKLQLPPDLLIDIALSAKKAAA